MKRFTFRLQRVLDYRETLKKEKERELALKNHELSSAEQSVQRILEEQNTSDGIAEGVKTMAEVGLVGDYLRGLQRALENQRVRVKEAQLAVEAARDAYIEKATDVKTLDTVKGKRHEEFLEEKARREKRTTDDIVVQRFRFSHEGPD